MARYMIFYNSPKTAAETMAASTPDEVRASMNEWIKWKDEASKTVKFEFGLPLQTVGRLTPEGITGSISQVSGYSFIEGESKSQILDLLRSHPHLKTPGASIDLLEVLSITGVPQ